MDVFLASAGVPKGCTVLSLDTAGLLLRKLAPVSLLRLKMLGRLRFHCAACWLILSGTAGSWKSGAQREVLIEDLQADTAKAALPA